ncbi:MAG TPA: UDP-N-acetylmuramate dehydrogenase [Candidatus Pelagibacter bacterium]|jgi:UDP-N-acetylmuramate dehydrogenase|nr:UDP-N-acetylmuramate dehydrogenase [Candidatus Pelagibacter bacterium]
MKINDIEKLVSDIDGDIFFNYDLKKLNWFNIGGKAEIFFKPNTLKSLVKFLNIYSKRGKIFILGAGSNVLINDTLFPGVIIKLGRNFSNISILNENLIVAGCATSQKNLSEYAKENNLGEIEFLSCIPGSVGGGIRMNSGCFEKEFKDILVSVQYIDFNGIVKTINSKNINFEYRGTNLPKDVIFLSATFKGMKKNKNKIQEKIDELKKKKEQSQPTRVKTGGSTFKNPKKKTEKKVWQLIKESIPNDLKFGDAQVSEKHSNFFVNTNNASFNDMKTLIDFVKNKVKEKTGIDISLEIIIVE